jgi:predicted transcriptional regulator
MPNEPMDAVGDSLKGIADDLGKIDGELESLQMSIEAESINLDPELAAGLKAALDTEIKQLDKLQADAQVMHKAAQAAVVCIRKGL